MCGVKFKNHSLFFCYCYAFLSFMNKFVSQKITNTLNARGKSFSQRTCVKLASNVEANLIQVYDEHRARITCATMIVFFTRQLFFSRSFHHIKISNLFSSTFLHSLRLINKICGMIMCIPFTIIFNMM